MNAAERWSNYAVTETGCWEWLGYADSNGYGRIYLSERPKGKQICWAHRAFYEKHVRPIPDGMEIDHTCCNTICVNPAHLDAVTREEHVRRTVARMPQDRHRRAAELRTLRWTYAEIADALGYSSKEGAHSAVVSAIAKGLVDADALPEAVPLTEAECEDIRAMWALGIPQRELAAWYRVDNSHISRICHGKRSRNSRSAA